MPGYVAEALKRFNHPPPSKPQHQPHKHVEPAYGQKIQYSPVDETPPLNKEGKTFIQQVTGTFLYYARAVDPTMLLPFARIHDRLIRRLVSIFWDCRMIMTYFLIYSHDQQSVVRIDIKSYISMLYLPKNDLWSFFSLVFNIID